MATFAEDPHADEELRTPAQADSSSIEVTTSGGNGLPLTRQCAACINGVHTEIVVTGYADRVNVLVTQLGSPGTILHASSEKSADGERRYEVKVLLGRRDDPLLAVYARQLIQRVDARESTGTGSSEDGRTIVVMLGLAKGGRDSSTFQAIMNLVLKARVW